MIIQINNSVTLGEADGISTVDTCGGFAEFSLGTQSCLQWITFRLSVGSVATRWAFMPVHQSSWCQLSVIYFKCAIGPCTKKYTYWLIICLVLGNTVPVPACFLSDLVSLCGNYASSWHLIGKSYFLASVLLATYPGTGNWVVAII